MNQKILGGLFRGIMTATAASRILSWRIKSTVTGRRLAFCKEHHIGLSGPALGKPPKDRKLSHQAKKQEY